MVLRQITILCAVLGISAFKMYAQEDAQVWMYTGTVYDEHFVPVPYTNVVAHRSGQGDMTDSMGIFSINVRSTDQLSFYNISFHDTTVFVYASRPGIHVMMRRKVYELPGAMIFNWGSTYQEFLAEVERQGVPEPMGEKLGLPRQDPGVIPFDMDEEKLKSTGFAVASPVSFLYYNLSKKEKGARRAFRLQKDQALIDRFNLVLGPSNLQRVTGLEDKELEKFIVFLNKELSCDYHCDELQLTRELLQIWERYKECNKCAE